MGCEMVTPVLWCTIPQAAEQSPRPEERIDPYDNDLVMGLREFVEHPDVNELVHNGATLQVSVSASLASHLTFALRV